MKLHWALFLVSCFIFYNNSLLFSQNASVFETDTVFFKNYTLDDRDSIMKNIRFKNHTLVDTVLNYSIFLDPQKNVHLEIFPEEKCAECFALDLKKLGVIDDDQSESDITKIESNTSRTTLPIFKTFKKKEKIYYQTIGKHPKIFFVASLKKIDTLESLPFFMESSDNVRLLLDNLKLSFSKDTTLLINGENVPCYCFKSEEVHITDDMVKFSLRFYEIFFEKASLLPLLTIKRYCYRNYFYSGDINTPSFWGISYNSSYIAIQ